MLDLAVAKSINSTQLSLIKAIKNGLNTNNFALVALEQLHGIGSNSNKFWEGCQNKFLNSSKLFKIDFFDEEMLFYDKYANCDLDLEANLYISFYQESLPKDLPMQSLSIYYAMVMKLVLEELGSEVFIKWPNDIYLGNKKIGGVLTTLVRNKVVCGIGMNIIDSPMNSNVLDVKINLSTLYKAFFDKILKKLPWKEIYSHYKKDFELSRLFYFNKENEIYALKDAKLYQDGSIMIENKRIYSLR